MVPLVPCVAMYLNMKLCTTGSTPNQWAFILAYQFMGIIFYALYGYSNSKMESKLERHHQKHGP
jgi:hypothetical protein